MPLVSLKSLDEKDRFDDSSGHLDGLRPVFDRGYMEDVFVWGEIVTITFYCLPISKMNHHLSLYRRHHKSP